MTILVPKELVDFWNSLPGDLPSLRLEYAPDLPLPQATYRSTGFARETLNAGFKEDIHRYEIAVIDDSPVDAFETGMDTAGLLDAFDPPGLVLCTVQPEQFATPMKAGQLDVWVFKINLTIRIIPA